MTSPHRRRHFVKLGMLSTLLGLIVALAVCEWLGWPFLRTPIERQLNQRLQRPVEISEPFSLHLLGSIRLSAGRLVIGPPPPGADTTPALVVTAASSPRQAKPATPASTASAPSPASSNDLLRASNAHLELPYHTVWNMLRSNKDDPPEPMRITALTVGDLQALLQRDPKGRNNWTLMPPKPADQASSAPVELPRIDKLVVNSGHVVVTDQMTDFDLDAQASTSEGERATGGSGLQVHGRGHYMKRPFEVNASSVGAIPLLASGEAAISVPIKLDASAGKAKVTFDGKGVDVLTLKGVEGKLSLSGPSLAAVGDAVGVTLPTTSLFSLKGLLKKSGEVWSLHDADLHVGDSRLGGRFSYDRRPKVPLLTGELTGSKFVLADLGPAFGAQAPGADNNPPPPAGRVLPQREFDIPSLHQMNADVKLKIQRVELGRFFAMPLQPLEGHLGLQSGVLSITDLLARTASGQVSGKLSLDANPKLPLWKANVQWAGIRLEDWLRPRNERDQVSQTSHGQAPGYVSGKLGGRAELDGRGRSTAQMLSSLEGNAHAWIQDGAVSHLMVEAMGLDVAQALGVLIKGDNPLPLRCAVTRVNAQHGQLIPDVAIADTEDSTVVITGSVSLTDEQLALKLTTTPKDKSPLTLRTPVKVEGTFSNPDVGLEAKPLGRKLLAATALALINPLAGLIPLIDLGDSQAGGCQEALARLKGTPVREAHAGKAKR